MGRRPAVSAGGCGYELRDWLRLAVVAALLRCCVDTSRGVFFHGVVEGLGRWGVRCCCWLFCLLLCWRRRGVAVAGREGFLEVIY
jgi:hypothetical protein